MLSLMGGRMTVYKCENISSYPTRMNVELYQKTLLNFADVNLLRNSMDSVTFSHKSSDTNDSNKENNGKFNIGVAAKNFFKGVASPITNMFKSPKDFLINSAFIAGCVALNAVTLGAAAPILCAAGIGMGAYSLGKGVIKIINAKNGDEAERAFEDLGSGALTVGLSVIGAKPALKAAGYTETELNSISNLKAATECFTQSPQFTSASLSNISNNVSVLTNKTNANKSIINAIEERPDKDQAVNFKN